MDIANVLLIVGLAVLVIGSRFAGRAVDQRRLLVLPTILCVYGFTLLRKETSISTADAAWLAVSGLAAVGTGLLRGTSIQLYARDGVLWSRYRALTLVWWILSIAVRFGVEAVAVSGGAHRAVMTSSLTLMFGVSLAAEAAIVLPRAWASGVPIAARS